MTGKPNPLKRLIYLTMAICACLRGFGPVDAFSATSSPQKHNKSKKSTIQETSDRRQFITHALSGLLAGTAVIYPVSDAQASSRGYARVQKWPGVEYLEPVYEFQLSLESIAEAAQDESQYAALQERLAQFFKGQIWSERNLYAGIALTYTTQIQYDPNEIREYARLDQEERFNLIENALDSLQSLYVSLTPREEGGTINKQDVADFSNGATACMRRWFSLIPTSEVDQAKELYQATRIADVNKDGKVDTEELGAVPEEYRALWKKRLEFTGA